MTVGPRAARAWRFASSDRLSARHAAPRSPSPAGAAVVGRSRELERLARGLVEVPVAVICGLPGIGKSTLAAAHAAAWPGPALELALSPGASIAKVCDAIGEQLGAAPGDPAHDDAARLDALWARLDGAAALAAIDDLHHLEPGARGLVLDTAVRRLRAGRLVTTSRELIPVPPGGPDRIQLRLDALDPADAARLWDRLTVLYGPGGDLDTAWRRSLGHPALLRQAHVATRCGDDPLVAAVQALEPAQRRIAGALALSSAALPLDAVLRLDPAAEAALAVLTRRMIVEITADGGCAMPCMMRAAVLHALGAAEQHELRAQLIAALRGGGLDAVTMVQESARHLRALGRHAELRALLAATGDRLIRQGATAALLDEILRDDDPDAAGPHELAVPPARRGQVVRARIRAVLRAACSGDAPRPDPQLDAAIPVSADYAFDRALLELARAVQAARHGRPRRAGKHVAAAAQHAAECGADPRLISALYEQLRAQADDDAGAPPRALVIDGARHELVDGAVRVPLATHPVLRRLLYAFATAADHFLDRAAIARALWRRDYEPAHHASAVKSNIRRLRDLLEGTRAMIETDRDGYRLVLPPGSQVVPPRA